MNALRAEWTKLRTVPGTGWLLAAIVVTTVAVGALATGTCSPRNCLADPTKLSLAGVQLGQAVVAILAVTAVSGEYSTGMIRTTLAAMPGRISVLAAKVTVVIGLVLPAAAIAVGTSVALSPPAVWSEPVIRAIAGSVLYLLLIAGLSVGVAVIVRDGAVAIGVVLGLLYLFPIVAIAVGNPDLQRHLREIGPMSAGLAVQATTDLDTLPIGPGRGLAVLVAWAVGSLALGALLLHRRDA